MKMVTDFIFCQSTYGFSCRPTTNDKELSGPSPDIYRCFCANCSSLFVHMLHASNSWK